MAYENIIFDWDGVIVKTPAIWNNSIAQAALEFDLKLTPEQIRIQAADFSKALEHGLPEKAYEAYSKRVIELAAPHIAHAPLYHGAEETLKKLRQNGKRLVILSSNQNAAEDVERKGMVQYFEFILSGRDVKNHKPNPEGVIKALSMLRVGHGEAAFVGDASTDVRAANSANVPSVLFYPRGHSKSHNSKELMDSNPTHTVTSHSQLTRLLTKSRNGNGR